MFLWSVSVASSSRYWIIYLSILPPRWVRQSTDTWKPQPPPKNNWLDHFFGAGSGYYCILPFIDFPGFARTRLTTLKWSFFTVKFRFSKGFSFSSFHFHHFTFQSTNSEGKSFLAIDCANQQRGAWGRKAGNTSQPNQVARKCNEGTGQPQPSVVSSELIFLFFLLLAVVRVEWQWEVDVSEQQTMKS